MGRIRLLDTFEDMTTKLSAAHPQAREVLTQLSTDPRLTQTAGSGETMPDLRIIHAFDDKGIYGANIAHLFNGPAQQNPVLMASIMLASRFNLTFYSLKDAAERAGRGEPTQIDALDAHRRVKHYLGSFPDAFPPSEAAPLVQPDKVVAVEPAKTVDARPADVSPSFVWPLVTVRPQPRSEKLPDFMGPPQPRERVRQPVYA